MGKSQKFDIKTADKQRKRLENGGAHDFSEVYSPPRATSVAEKMGLNAGWALDIIRAAMGFLHPGEARQGAAEDSHGQAFRIDCKSHVLTVLSPAGLLRIS